MRLIRQPAYDVYQYFLFCGNTIAFAEGELLLRPIKSVLGLPNVYIENIIYHHIYPPPKIFQGIIMQPLFPTRFVIFPLLVLSFSLL